MLPVHVVVSHFKFLQPLGSLQESARMVLSEYWLSRVSVNSKALYTLCSLQFLVPLRGHMVDATASRRPFCAIKLLQKRIQRNSDSNTHRQSLDCDIIL